MSRFYGSVCTIIQSRQAARFCNARYFAKNLDSQNHFCIGLTVSYTGDMWFQLGALETKLAFTFCIAVSIRVISGSSKGGYPQRRP